jgi:dTDP-4-dehydrorhamnose reductase
MTQPKILLTGCNGQVGFELQRSLAPLGELVAIDVDDCDLTDADAVRQLVRSTAPALVVNPAAYTAVDQAESEPAEARRVNRDAPGLLARRAMAFQAPIIHYSTDYVFDGASAMAYVEEDPTDPTSVYGKTKLAGERAVRESGARHLILRLAWVYDTRSKNFLTTMLRLANEGREIKVVNDQTGAPTWARLVAAATASIATRILSGAKWTDGVYHLPAGGATTWHDYAQAIFELAAGHGLIQQVPQLTPITTAEYPTAAERPANSVMSGAKLEQQFDLKLPDWRKQLELALEDY